MKFSVDQLLSDGTQWDRLIAADLAKELKTQLAEKVDTIPEMRRLLAVKGYRELRGRLEREVAGLAGREAVEKMAFTFRAFAHERPGLSAATFRTPASDSEEWRRESELLGRVSINILKGVGLAEGQAATALRILRALVRGFVLHEIASSFADDVSYDHEYAVAVKVYVCGLDFLVADQ